VKYSVDVAGRVIEVEIDDQGIRVDGKPIEVRLLGTPGTAQRRLARGRDSRGMLVVTGEEPGAWRLAFDGARVDALVLDERRRIARNAGRAGTAATASGTLKAPMPGLVVRVLVQPGQQVEAGQGLLVMEAMKMENELKAWAAGSVARIMVEPGAKVEKGAPLLELSANPAAG
jgi:pyruvate carboxylase subunit B